MAKFIVKTLGCKVNQYEAAAIRQTLRRAGLRDHDGFGAVALCVVHTCCVTSTAGQKSRQIVRRLASTHPDAHIVVTGCYASASPKILSQLAGVTTIVGHHDDVAEQLTRLAGTLKQAEPDAARSDNSAVTDKHTALSSISPIRPFLSPNVKGFQGPGTGNLAPLERFDQRHRAIVKVQDGCDGFCSYCIVAHLRDRLWSRPVDRIVAEVRRLTDVGHREIVLCGVNLGAYGRETVHRDRWGDDDDRLADLVATVADAAAPARVRLSSLGPPDVTDRLLDVMASYDNICPHIHLSLQSGSTPILERMNRRYSATQFAQTVDRIGQKLDEPAITTDIIVGFPGESDEDFAATMAAARHAGFAKIHIFPFSPREGTAAAKWSSERPHGDVVRRRVAELAAVEAELAVAYRSQFVGETVDVLLEEALDTGAAGLTPRYHRVEVTDADADQLGHVVSATITAAGADGLLGRMAAISSS